MSNASPNADYEDRAVRWPTASKVRGKPNCMAGYNVHNRHNNCPYALICAVCDIDDEQQRRESAERIDTEA